MEIKDSYKYGASVHLTCVLDGEFQQNHSKQTFFNTVLFIYTKCVTEGGIFDAVDIPENCLCNDPVATDPKL